VLGALQAESFPMEKPELYYAVGDLALTDDAGRIVTVRELLEIRPRRRHAAGTHCAAQHPGDVVDVEEACLIDAI
jgi:hypothetical protein